MYRIRFHGRGGQGVKTASRILGTAFFIEHFEVQDAPRYGAERRGAPIFAYVRAAKHTINERGIIRQPDLVVVADDTLIPVPAAGVLNDITQQTVLLINSYESDTLWRKRLNIQSPILILPATQATEDRASQPFIGAACAGAAASLLGVIPLDSLKQAIKQELSQYSATIITQNIDNAESAFQLMQAHKGCVTQGTNITATSYASPDWIEMPVEDASISAPVIHAGLTSIEVKTGLWRTLRPVIDYERCKGCWWICSNFCPDAAIKVTDKGLPEIDYDHCKGCMVCVAQCPPHAIEALPEHSFQVKES